MSKTFTPKAVLGVGVVLLQLGCSDSTSASDARDAQPDTERVDAPAVALSRDARNSARRSHEPRNRGAAVPRSAA